MKILFFLFFLFAVVGCSSNEAIYWCGDHACINNKEKEDYFKKTMIVEIREIKGKESKRNSEIEQIILQSQKEEKKKIKIEKDLSKQARLEEKRKRKEDKIKAKMALKEEKQKIKQAKLDKKKRKSEEKKLLKQIKREEAKTIKINKNKQRKIIEKKSVAENQNVISSNFSSLVKKIKDKNFFKPYPDINDIPN